MDWLFLLIAGVLETAWAIGLKQSQGFSRLWPSVWTIITAALSFYFLALALRTLPVGTAYAIWTGIGAALTAGVGMFFLDEPRTTLRIASILLIVSGVIGLRVASESS